MDGEGWRHPALFPPPDFVHYWWEPQNGRMGSFRNPTPFQQGKATGGEWSKLEWITCWAKPSKRKLKLNLEDVSSPTRVVAQEVNEAYQDSLVHQLPSREASPSQRKLDRTPNRAIPEDHHMTLSQQWHLSRRKTLVERNIKSAHRPRQWILIT